ncbi:hypothetical protein [Streptomyces sp. NPDC056405]|uniref:hypothetical protein n=1 Tax=Streptomyces sp. NPDC056405 TaxID=3345811 RepID=UPI0035E26A27
MVGPTKGPAGAAGMQAGAFRLRGARGGVLCPVSSSAEASLADILKAALDEVVRDCAAVKRIEAAGAHLARIAGLYPGRATTREILDDADVTVQALGLGQFWPHSPSCSSPTAEPCGGTVQEGLRKERIVLAPPSTG